MTCLILLAIMIKFNANIAMTEDNDKAFLEQTYAEMYRAMIAKDTAVLGSMLDDSFVLVHMTGMRQAKHDYLRAIANGTLNYYSCDGTRLEISVNGENARMTGRSRVAAAVFGGGKHTWRLRLDMKFLLKNGECLIVETVASTW